MFHKSAWIFAVLGAAGILSGCGPPRAGTSDEVLVGAKFEIPVYPGARVVARKSVMFQEEEPDGRITSFDTLTWELQTSDPVERVRAYYESRLPDAERRDSRDDDARGANDPGGQGVELEYVPSGAAEGDRIVITIGEEGLEIDQITRRP